MTLPYWHRSLGILLIILGIYVFSTGEHVSGYSKGYEECANNIVKLIEQKKNEHEN